DAALDVALRVRPRVALDHLDSLDDDFAVAGIHNKDSSSAASVLAAQDVNFIVFLNRRNGRHQITSGASETIFMNLLSRSSRAKGPKTRVPIGSWSSLMRTAAFSSKRIYDPSFRRCSFLVRTMTHFTTDPFFTLLSGLASLTDAVTMSPRLAFK